MPARRGDRRRTRRRCRIRLARRDPAGTRTTRCDGLRRRLRPARSRHRRHPDDAVHRRGHDPRLGAIAHQGNLPRSDGGTPRLPALVSHAGIRVARRRVRRWPGRLVDRRRRAPPSASAGQHLPRRTGTRRSRRDRATDQRLQGLRGRDASGAGRVRRMGLTRSIRLRLLHRRPHPRAPVRLPARRIPGRRPSEDCSTAVPSTSR
jgi:hypothetical protein